MGVAWMFLDAKAKLENTPPCQMPDYCPPLTPIDHAVAVQDTVSTFLTAGVHADQGGVEGGRRGGGPREASTVNVSLRQVRRFLSSRLLHLRPLGFHALGL